MEDIVIERLDFIRYFEIFDEVIHQSLMRLEPTDFTRVIFNSIVEMKLYSYLMISIDNDEYYDVANKEVNKYYQYVKDYLILQGSDDENFDTISNSVISYCNEVIKIHGLEKLIEIFIYLGGTDKIKTLDNM